MHLMKLSQQTVGASCVLIPVTAYTNAASTKLNGGPVAAAMAVGDGRRVIVSAGAQLLVVSREGSVDELGTVVSASTGALLSLSSLSLSSPCSSLGKCYCSHSLRRYEYCSF